jgi:hypothetical protein
MTAFRMRLATALTAAAVLATSFVPVSAMPSSPAPVAALASSTSPAGQVTEVQYRRDERRHYRHDRRVYREGYYNGHRGYRERRRGYRQHNGYWFPLAAFATGAIIGGAVASPPRASGGSHVQWCADRYRTYRAYDNTYVSSPGVRRSCNSPYR